jgi:hypothetical protein
MGLARLGFSLGLLATVVALLLIFVPFGGPNRCLDDVGPNADLTPPCPPFDQDAADRANIVTATLFYGGPTLVGVSGLILLVTWARKDDEVEAEDS